MSKIVQEYVVVDKGSTVVAGATNKIKGSLRGVSASAGSTSTAMNKMGMVGQGVATRMGGSFGALAASGGPMIAVAAAVTAIVAAFKGLKASVQVAADFEKNMANVSTLVDTTQVNMKKLTLQVLELPSAYGKATENAKALYQAISAGIDPAKSVAFVGEAAKAAKAGLSDTFTAVDVLTSVLNSYGDSAERVTTLSDEMFVAIKLGKTTFEELAGAMGRVTPLAATLKVSTGELLSAITTLTKAGIKTDEAVTGLKSAFSNIIKPGKAAQKMAEELGIQFDAAALQSKGLKQFLLDVQTATDGDVEKMAKLFRNVKGLNTILTLTSETGAKNMTQALEGMAKSAGETSTAFEKQTKTASHMKDSFAASFEKIGIIVGSQLLPPLKMIGERFADLLGSKETMNLIEAAAWTLGKAFTAIATAINLVIGVLKIFIDRVSIPIQLIKDLAGVITGSVTPMELFKNLWEGFSQILRDIVKLVSNLIRDLGQLFGLMDTFEAVANKLDKAYEGIANKAKDAARATKELFTGSPEEKARYEKLDQVLSEMRGGGEKGIRFTTSIGKTGKIFDKYMEGGMSVEKTAKLIIQIEGEGSTRKPITEKLLEVQGKIGGLSDFIGAAAPNMKVAFEDKNGNPIIGAIDRASDSFDGLFGDVIQGSMSVSQAFSQMGVNIIKSFANILESQAVQGLKDLMFGTGGGGGGGGWIGLIGSGISSMFGGGYAGAGTYGVSPGDINWHASGGTFKPGQLIGVGEKGPEVIATGNQGGTVIPNDQLGGDKEKQTNIYIQAMDSQSFFDFARRNPDAFVEVINDQVNKGNSTMLSSINKAGRM